MHVAWGIEMIGGGWRVAGAGDFQVDGTSRWERRWVAGDTQRECYANEWMLMEGGGRM